MRLLKFRRQGKSRAYLHNALGQRVFKSEPQVAQTMPDANEVGGDFFHWLQSSFGWLFARNRQPSLLGQSYMYGDGQLGSYNLLGEYGNGGSKSSGRVEYLWLPTETGSAQLIGLYRNHRFHAVHTDHLGTPRLITDDENQPVWQWSYSAFGDNQPTGILKATTHPKQAVTNVPQMLKATNPIITLNLRFAGQYWDEESKLSYNYFRSYQGSQGRYTQSDPIGLAGGINTYSYVWGNPLRMVDPTGLDVTININRDTYTSKSVTGTISVSSDVTGVGSFTGFTLETATAGPKGDKNPISQGSYSASVRFDHSPNRIELLNVLGFKNIQIHEGNTADDVEGCFAVGKSRSKNFVGNSNAALSEILKIVKMDGSGRISVNVTGSSTAP